MRVRCLSVVLIWALLAGLGEAFPLDPVRIYYADSAPSADPLTVVFTVWQGGDQKRLKSGKLLYKEQQTVEPKAVAKDSDIAFNLSESYISQRARFEGWLGRGEVLFGELKGEQFGLDKDLYLQIEFPGFDKISRYGLCAIDNAYTICNRKEVQDEQSLRLKGKYFKKYTPDFNAVTPEHVRQGLAILYPDGRLQTEEGSYVSTAGTTTSGVQEFFDYCANHNVDGYIVGGSIPNSQQIPYLIWSPVRIRPAQGLRIDTGAITLQFMPQVGDQPGLTIDSCMMCDIRIRGLVYYLGDGYAVAIKPENPLPLDKFVGPTLVDTSIFIMSIACRGSKGALLMENSINFCRFELNEINHGDVGVHVSQKQAFSNNHFICKHIHGQENANMLIEGGGSNTWEVSLNCDGKDPRGIVTSGRDDIWFASVISRSKSGLVFQPEAQGNRVFLQTFTGGIENLAQNPINRIYPSPGMPADKLGLGYACPTPPVPASGELVVNRSPLIVTVMILNGGSVKSWVVNDSYGVAQQIDAPLTGGQQIILAPGEAIRLIYPAEKPQWKWRSLP